MVIAMVEVMVIAMEVKVTAMGVMVIHMRNIPMAIIQIWKVCSILSEPGREKTGPWGFQPGPTHTGLYSHRS